MTPQERNKKIKIVEDFFEIIENNPPKGTFAYIYYFSEYQPSGLRKFIRDDNGRRIKNELYNNLYKNTVVKFNYESTYRDKIKKTNPDWTIQKSNRNNTKIDGYDLIEIDEKGEIEIPVADPIIVYQQYYKKLEDGRFIDISEDYMRYFMSSNIIQQEPKSGVKFGRYKLDKIYKMSVYGNVWKNPLFIYKNNDITSLRENLLYNGTLQLNESLNSSKLEKACDSMLTRQNKKNPIIETKQDFFKFLFFNKNDKYKTDIIEDKDVVYPIKNLDRYKDLLNKHGNKSGCALWRKISTDKLEIKPSNRDLDDNWKFEEGVVIKNNNNTVKKSEKYINKEKIDKIKPTASSKLHKKISSKLLTETVERNVITVKITVPNEQILKRLNSTPTFNRLSRLELQVGENIENINHAQFDDMVRIYPLIGVTVEEIELNEDWKHNTKTAVLAGALSLSSLFSGLANVNAGVSDNSLSKLSRDVIEFMDVNQNNAEYKKDDALDLGKQILNTQESVYTGVGKSQKSLEDAKKIAANNAINFYKQETGGKQQPTNIKYQHKTRQVVNTSKGINQTTYSVLAILVF